MKKLTKKQEIFKAEVKANKALRELRGVKGWEGMSVSWVRLPDSGHRVKPERTLDQLDGNYE